MLCRFWALNDDALSALEHAAHSPGAPTAADHRAILAADAPKIRETRGSVATIKIEGVLTARPDVLAALFGGGNTTYSSIKEALQRADRDPDVRSIVLSIDSPGGEVRGLFELLAAIRAVKKPISVSASLAASAAYAIAAVAGKIEATSKAATFGSIGVAASFWTSPNLVDITSSAAPAKRPDVKTEAGRAMVRRQLDDIHELFVEEVARGRGVSAKQVNETFGRGAVVLGREAKRLGMIDSIAEPGGPEAGSAEWNAKALIEQMLPKPARPPARSMLDRSADAYCGPEGDLGDQVVAQLEREREHVVSAPATPDGGSLLDRAADAYLGGDLGDEVVSLLKQHGGS